MLIDLFVTFGLGSVDFSHLFTIKCKTIIHASIDLKLQFNETLKKEQIFFIYSFKSRHFTKEKEGN